MYEGSFSHHTTFSVGIYLKKKKNRPQAPCDVNQRAGPGPGVFIFRLPVMALYVLVHMCAHRHQERRSDDPLNKINLFSFFLLLLFFNHLRDVCSLGDYSRRSTGKLSHIFPQCHLYYIENITCGEITHDTLLPQREEPLFLCIAFNI